MTVALDTEVLQMSYSVAVISVIVLALLF